MSGSHIQASGFAGGILTGGTGRDLFRFNSAPAVNNIDKITDFSVIDDTLQLDHAIFTQLGAHSVLNSDKLNIGPAAADANDFIIYNPSTGALFYDADGNGAGNAVQIATLSVNLALTDADVWVI